MLTVLDWPHASIPGFLYSLLSCSFGLSIGLVAETVLGHINEPPRRFLRGGPVRTIQLLCLAHQLFQAAGSAAFAELAER